MAGSGGGGGGAPPPASTRTSLSDYLDGPRAIHRRAASLAIVRSGGGGAADGPRIVDEPGRDDRRMQSSRRASLSLWRSSNKAPPSPASEPDRGNNKQSRASAAAAAWRSWAPVRALAHLGKRRAGCLFSVEVDAVRGVPAHAEGARLAVTVRKAEGGGMGGRGAAAVQTMPSRVRGGGADFDETLFVRCSLFFTGGAGTGKPLRIEPRRFVVSVVALEPRGARRLGAAHTVDLSALVLDSVGGSEGRRARRVDRVFALSTGGELVLKLGFQLMDDAGLSLYAQPEETTATAAMDVAAPAVASSRARAHNKNSFSISSTTPKLSPNDAYISPSMRDYKQLVDRLRIEENGDPVIRYLEPRKPGNDGELSESTTTDAGDAWSLPEYEVVEKGVETVVKEVVHYQAQRDVLRELDSIAEQIEAIEAMMANGGNKSPKAAVDQQQQQQRLDADEEMVTVEFLRKLEDKLKQPVTPRTSQPPSPRKTPPPHPVVPDLGQGIGPAVQTRDGGFLVSMNPFDLPLESRDGPPRLAMQVSRPFVLPGATVATGFDVLQRMAAVAGGADEVRGKLASLGGMDDITGKTPGQVGFEGIAEAVIAGRRVGTEGEGDATSSAARSVRLVRKLAAAVSEGRGERVATGIWTAGDDPETLEEVLAFSIQKLEAMAVDALAVQAEMADEDAPFHVAAAGDAMSVFDALVPTDEWSESGGGGGADGRVTLVVAIQLRDPSRRYEAVGAPMVAVVQSARLLGAAGHRGGVGGGRFKVRSLHVGGVQTRCPAPGAAAGSASWGAERQKLTAMQWMVAHGPGRAGGKRAMTPTAKARARAQRPDVVWSLSSRVLAGMWLKTVRNPDVRIGAGSST